MAGKKSNAPLPEPTQPIRKAVFWVGSARQDLRDFAPDVKRVMGYALYRAELGQTHPKAKPLKHLVDGTVTEIVENDESGTYRVVYTIEFKEALYVLHAFQKKSKRGISTPRHDLDTIRRRYFIARQHYRTWRKEQDEKNSATHKR
jgi:phage-related protein